MEVALAAEVPTGSRGAHADWPQMVVTCSNTLQPTPWTVSSQI